MFSKIVLFAIFVALSQQKANPDYTGCADDYQCFGLDASGKDGGCIDKKSCLVLLKTQAQQSGEVEFNLYWERDSNSSDSWVAAALSEDNMMGDDSATVFIIDDKGALSSMEGLTFVKKSGKNESAGVTPEQVKGISIKRNKYVNGLLSAKWTRDPSTTVGKITFDMKAKKYYILLAYGPVVKGTTLKHHTNAGVSDKSVNLEEEPKAASTSTTSKPTSAPTTPPTTKPTGSPVTTPKPTASPSGSTSTGTVSTAPTIITTEGNSTATTSNSTATPSNTTGTSAGTTPKPHHSSTHKPNNASTLTMSLFLTIFGAILLILN